MSKCLIFLLLFFKPIPYPVREFSFHLLFVRKSITAYSIIMLWKYKSLDLIRLLSLILLTYYKKLRISFSIKKKEEAKKEKIFKEIKQIWLDAKYFPFCLFTAIHFQVFHFIHYSVSKVLKPIRVSFLWIMIHSISINYLMASITRNYA